VRARAYRALLALGVSLLATGPLRAPAAEPTDPWFPSEWPLHNTGQLYPQGCDPNTTCAQGTPDADIDWLEAWEAGATGSGVILAVGTAPSAPTVSCQNLDLVGRLWVNPGESGGGKETNGIDDDSNGFVDDVHGANFDSNDGDVCLSGTSSNHDTDAARLALAEVNGFGTVGVAPGAQLMLLSGWGGSVGTFFTEALDYADVNGARVIVAPYGGWVTGGVPFQTEAECAAFGNPPGPANYSQDLSQSDVLVLWGRSDRSPSIATRGSRAWRSSSASWTPQRRSETRTATIRTGGARATASGGSTPTRRCCTGTWTSTASTATGTRAACSATACAHRGRAWAVTTTAPP
jgi:hypothetical protein